MKFVIHHHRTNPDHYDLMLERDEALITYRIDEHDIGGLMAGARVRADKINDHRRDYLEYEGPVSCDRGRVEFYDRGEYRVIETGAGFFRAEMLGDIIRGIFRFSAHEIENCWTIDRE